MKSRAQRLNRKEMKSLNDELREAAEAGDLSGLNALLLHPECDPKSMRPGGLTALMHATSKGHVDCVRLLLPVSNARAKSREGVTALMQAAAWGHHDCVQLLLPLSDALAQSEGGRTALMYAAIWEHPDCIQLLLPVSEVFMKDIKGMSAGDHAKETGQDSVVNLIDAYVLALDEAAALFVVAVPVKPRKYPSLRM